ncbi:hypothetical protein D3C78_1131540 [compost metagenome]
MEVERSSTPCGGGGGLSAVPQIQHGYFLYNGSGNNCGIYFWGQPFISSRHYYFGRLRRSAAYTMLYRRRRLPLRGGDAGEAKSDGYIRQVRCARGCESDFEKGRRGLKARRDTA